MPPRWSEDADRSFTAAGRGGDWMLGDGRRLTRVAAETAGGRRDKEPMSTSRRLGFYCARGTTTRRTTLADLSHTRPGRRQLARSLTVVACLLVARRTSTTSILISGVSKHRSSLSASRWRASTASSALADVCEAYRFLSLYAKRLLFLLRKYGAHT